MSNLVSKIIRRITGVESSLADLHRKIDLITADQERLLLALGNQEQQHDQTRTELHADLLEMTTAITRAFMEETIEIKEALEIIVDGRGFDASKKFSQQRAYPSMSGFAATPVAPPREPTPPCAQPDCNHPAEMDAKMSVDGAPRLVKVCEQHAQALIQEAFAKSNLTQIPDPEEFRRAQGVEDGKPDPSVMNPEPMDPLTAAIEAAYRQRGDK